MSGCLLYWHLTMKSNNLIHQFYICVCSQTFTPHPIYTCYSYDVKALTQRSGLLDTISNGDLIWYISYACIWYRSDQIGFFYGSKKSKATAPGSGSFDWFSEERCQVPAKLSTGQDTGEGKWDAIHTEMDFLEVSTAMCQYWRWLQLHCWGK
jgi:hypothetical protein